MVSLSVIVPTYQRAAPLRDTLRDALAQLPDGAELLVVDQSDAQQVAATAAFLAELGDPRAVHHVLPAPGLPNARNVGIARSRGELLVFLDDDVRLHPGFFAGHLAEYADPTVGAVAGRIDETKDRPNVSGTVNRVGRDGRVRTNLSGRTPGPIDTVKGANHSVRRRVFEQIGGYDRRFGGTAFLEEADLSARATAAGWRIRFAPGASLLHLSSPSGGVRPADPADALWWRFHNTGLYAGRHLRKRDLPRVWATYAAIAARQAPLRAAKLLLALRAGLAASRLPPLTEITP